MRVKCSIIKTNDIFYLAHPKYKHLVMKLLIKIKDPQFRFLNSSPESKSIRELGTIRATDLAFQKRPKEKETIYFEISCLLHNYKKVGKQKIKTLLNNISNTKFKSNELLIKAVGVNGKILFSGGRPIITEEHGEIFSEEYEITNDDIKGPDGFIKYVLKNEENKKV